MLLGVDVVRYSFIVRDLHPLLLAGLPAHTCVTDHRDPNRIDHTLVEMLRLRMFAIAAGYEDSSDCTTLRYDSGIEFIDENGGGLGVRFRNSRKRK
jgi:hypothetical protein